MKNKMPLQFRQKSSCLVDRITESRLGHVLGIGNRSQVINIDKAIRTGSFIYFRDLFADKDRMIDIFNIDEVEKLYKAHMERSINANFKLCTIASIIQWRRQFGL